MTLATGNRTFSSIKTKTIEIRNDLIDNRSNKASFELEKELDDLLETCKSLWNDFNNCKAHFPYTPSDAKGLKEVRTALYYIAQGFDISFSFSQPLSEEAIAKINQIGHWLNQNFIIRLCAILEYFGVISNSEKIDLELEGAYEVNIVRRLRNCFVHSSGRYNPKDRKHRVTIELIRTKIDNSIG